jgi:hypothetical protein
MSIDSLPAGRQVTVVADSKQSLSTVISHPVIF